MGVCSVREREGRGGGREREREWGREREKGGGRRERDVIVYAIVSYEMYAKNPPYYTV